MEEVVLVCYDVLTVMLPTGVLTILSVIRGKKQGRLDVRRRAIRMILFGLYLFGLFHVTGAGTLYDAIRYGAEFHPSQLNLVPFSDDMINRSVLISHAVLNILLFIPFGVLLPLIWRNLQKVWQVILTGFLLSVVVELSQLLNHRSTDIDDLILNVFGTFIGILLFRFIFRKGKQKGYAGRTEIIEMVIFIAAAFLCRFLAFDEFGAAKLLYGF
ncbi:MAG: VanZ family protein [Parasporobacterium sp.]|nr:VanZ family protein [Parasporobacterium sp.]